MSNTRVIHRRDLPGFLRHMTDRRPDGHPLFPIFSVYVARREDLFLRYYPIDNFTNGPLARVGDYNLISDRGRAIVRNGDREFALDVENAKAPIFHRRGTKIVLEEKGTWRWMTIKNWAKDQPHAGTKHWQPKGESLNFDPAAHDLFLVMGMYNDRTMRYGQWRPFAMICMRSCAVIRVDGIEYKVKG